MSARSLTRLRVFVFLKGMCELKKLFNILAYIVLALTFINLLEKGMQWIIKTYDPDFKRILDAKTKGANDVAYTKETVFAVLRNQNGQSPKIVREG